MEFLTHGFDWQALSQRLLLMLIHFTWQATLVSGFLALTLRWLPRDRARSRYAVSVGGLILLPMAALLTLLQATPQSRSFANRAEAANHQGLVDPAVIASLESDAARLSAPPPDGREPTGAPANEVLRSDPRATSDVDERWTATIPVSFHQVAPWVSALYSLGVLWMLARTMIGVTEGRRLCREAVPITTGLIAELMVRLSRDIGLSHTPAIARSKEIMVPAVIGVLRPTILLPCSLVTGLMPNEISAILSHELAHIRRHDVCLGIFQRVLESLFFFHPAVWWISAQVSREREHCCDDAAIGCGHATTGYVEALLRAAELCLSNDRAEVKTPPVGVSFLGESRSELTRRVERLLAVEGSKRWAMPRVFAIGLTLAFLGAFACLGARGQGAGGQGAGGQGARGQGGSANASGESQDSSEDIFVGRVAIQEASKEAADVSRAEQYRKHLIDARTTGRAGLLKAFGGTAETEESVASGLRWILRQQRSDGSWSFEPVASNASNGDRADSMALAGTAMALLALTGDGNTHHTGEHREAVKRGTAFLLTQQSKDGRFGRKQMYVHAITSYAIADLYALTGDAALKPSLRRAVNYSIQAQNPIGGGWRYMPRQGGDLSMTTWFVAGLSRARDADISIPDATLGKAKKFVESTDTGKGFGYLPGSPATPSMTGAGLLCLQRLSGAWQADSYSSAARAIRAVGFRSSDQDFYQWLQVTQALRQNGGETWEEWNQALRKELPRMQHREGAKAGSWPHGQAKYGKPVGPLYTTCFAVLTLQSYYRDGTIPSGQNSPQAAKEHTPIAGSVVRIFVDSESAQVQATPDVKIGFLQSILSQFEQEGIESIQIAALTGKPTLTAKDKKRSRIDLNFDEGGVEIRVSKTLPYKHVMTVLKALDESGFESVKIGVGEN
ncbi:MAG: M56 family metallopeptidase [Planctomycetota bacterium]